MKSYVPFTLILPYKYSKCKYRQEALSKVVNCLMTQEFKEFELIVTEYTDEEAMFPYKELADKYIVSVCDKPFNKSWIVNQAVKEASHNYVAILDADNLFGTNFTRLVAEFTKSYKVFQCANRSYLQPGPDNPLERVINFNEKRALMGCWCISKDVFWKVGGMNENYFGYGAEDNDMWIRANELDKIQEMQYNLTHSYHPWSQAPNERRLTLEVTTQYPKEVTQLLREASLGMEQPTVINIDSLIERLKEEYPDEYEAVTNTVDV